MTMWANEEDGGVQMLGLALEMLPQLSSLLLQQQLEEKKKDEEYRHKDDVIESRIHRITGCNCCC